MLSSHLSGLTFLFNLHTTEQRKIRLGEKLPDLGVTTVNELVQIQKVSTLTYLFASCKLKFNFELVLRFQSPHKIFYLIFIMWCPSVDGVGTLLFLGYVSHLLQIPTHTRYLLCISKVNMDYAFPPKNTLCRK